MQPAPLAPEDGADGADCGRVATLDGPDGSGLRTAAYVRPVGGCWSQVLGYVPPGSELEYAIAYRNTSEAQHDDVVLRVELPDGARLVSGSTTWMNASHPEGVPATSDDVEGLGINVGSYGPGANAWLMFRVVVAGADEVDCGVSEYRVQGFSRASGVAETSNTAVLSAYREC